MLTALLRRGGRGESREICSETGSGAGGWPWLRPEGSCTSHPPTHVYTPPPWHGRCVLIVGPFIQEKQAGSYLSCALCLKDISLAAPSLSKDDRHNPVTSGETQRGCTEAGGKARLLPLTEEVWLSERREEPWALLPVCATTSVAPIQKESLPTFEAMPFQIHIWQDPFVLTLEQCSL